MAKKRTTNAQKRQRKARERVRQLRYPDYVVCPSSEAIEALGEGRAAQLSALYGAELRKADVRLELLLRSGEVRVVDRWHPEGRLRGVGEYMASWNADMHEEAARDEWTPFADEQDFIDQLHQWHGEDSLRVDRDGALEWTW